MSRIAYSDEESWPGQFNLWQANCERSVSGKQGQVVLRELEEALVALPSKRLQSHIVACNGEICAVGAWLLMRKAKEIGSIDEARRQLETEMGERDRQHDIDTARLGANAGMPHLVAWKLVEMNDIQFDDKWVTVEGPLRYDWQYYHGSHRKQSVPLTSEERYEAVLAWVRSKLKEQSVKTGMIRRRG